MSHGREDQLFSSKSVTCSLYQHAALNESKDARITLQQDSHSTSSGLSFEQVFTVEAGNREEIVMLNLILKDQSRVCKLRDVPESKHCSISKTDKITYIYLDSGFNFKSFRSIIVLDRTLLCILKNSKSTDCYHFVTHSGYKGAYTIVSG